MEKAVIRGNDNFKNYISLPALKKIIMDNSDMENLFNEIIWAIEEIEK